MARMTPKLFKYTALFALMATCLPSYASTVRDDVDYQLFRDFAENKGKFTIDPNNKNANIAIFNKNGESIGVMLQGVPMPDFSSVHSKRGTHTLIDPQYVVSVAHNEPSVIHGETPFEFRHYNQEFGGQTFNPDNHRYIWGGRYQCT